jgi:hypothetical protein
MQSTSYYCQILVKLEFSLEIFRKIQISDNAEGQTDRQTDEPTWRTNGRLLQFRERAYKPISHLRAWNVYATNTFILLQLTVAHSCYVTIRVSSGYLHSLHIWLHFYRVHGRQKRSKRRTCSVSAHYYKLNQMQNCPSSFNYQHATWL